MFINKIKNYYIYRVFKSIKERGFIKTCKLIYDEKIFDLVNRTNTSGIKSLLDLEIKYSSKENGFRYEGTNRTAFFKIFKNLQINKSDYTFIDLGCGKGLALLLALKVGFKKVIGVEFSGELSEISICNLQKYIINNKLTDVIYTIYNQDVVEFKPPFGNLVFFMCNPFDEKIINASFSAYKKYFDKNSSIYIIYINALYKEELLNLGFCCDYYYKDDPLDVYKNGMVVLTKLRN